MTHFHEHHRLEHTVKSPRMDTISEKTDTSGPGRVVEIRPLSSGQGLRERTSKSGRTQQYLAAVVVCILAFCFGNVVGWVSPVTDALKSDTGPVGAMTTNGISWLGSLTFLGGIVGALFWGRIADIWGRKIAGYSVTVPFIIGWAIILGATNPILLYVARIFTGLSGSGGLIVPPMYISEIAEDSIRGALGSFIILFMNGGIVASYALGAALSYRYFVGVLLAVPILFNALFYWLPETPAYLWSKSRRDEAESSLLWFRGNDHKKVHEELSKYRNMSTKQESATYSMLCNTKGARKAMIIGLGLFSWQQLNGILALLTFVSSIFTDAGSTLDSNMSAIIVGLVQLAASYVSSIIVDRSGRKILLLISYLFMGLSLVVLSVYLYLKDTNVNLTNFSWLPIAALCVHVSTYAIGAGPVPYVVMNETLSPKIRGLATSTIIFWGTFVSGVSVQIFPYLEDAFYDYGSFLFFAVFCLIGFIFTWILVPETKGIPLEDILARLNGEPVTALTESDEPKTT